MPFPSGPVACQEHAAANPSPGEKGLREALRLIHHPLQVVRKGDTLVPHVGNGRPMGDATAAEGQFAGYAPPCRMEHLGDLEFCADHGIRYPYLSGSMAKGISSSAMVEAMGHAGMLGFFGAAGLPLPSVEAAIDRISASLGDLPYGFNLIHSPHEPDLEAELVNLYLRRGVTLIEASAFLNLTLPVVRYRVRGIHRAPSGEIVTPNRIIAKVSREEVAGRFFSPPPDQFLRELVAAGEITGAQAELAALVPMAQDITAEADSGGHTDNRPAIALLPTICGVRDRMQERHKFHQKLRVGLAGGIATPMATAGAFAMGAAYVMTGSVNQACLESGTSDEVRTLLAETRQADLAMAPAADMFEMGVTVQVLKRGTMFPMRAAKLYELYRAWGSTDAIPAAEREKLEKTLFRAPLADIWQETRAYFVRRDVRQVERAERDPKHRMALIFRWYLGQASHWANNGEPARKVDYQVWCGPAMGAFNEWVSGSFLDRQENRRVVTVALNLLFGAAVTMRVSALRCQGVAFPPEMARIEPLEIETIKEFLC